MDSALNGKILEWRTAEAKFSIRLGGFSTAGHRGKPPDVRVFLLQAIKRAGVKSRVKSQELEMNSALFCSQRHLRQNKRWNHHPPKKKQSCNPLGLLVILVQTKTLWGTFKSRALAEECSALGVWLQLCQNLRWFSTSLVFKGSTNPLQRTSPKGFVF